MRRIPKEIKKQIIELYPNNYTKDISKKLNISTSSIYNVAFLNNIKKSAEFMKMELQKQADRLRIVGVKSRIKKGNIPPNKGVKMDSATYEKAKRTFFKPGNIPHNTKYDGYERINIEGYTEVRVNGKFILKNRLIYQNTYGKIDSNTLIIFKDGNKQNFNIDNLQAITKKENAIRNSIHRYPEELKSIIRLNTKLKKRIKKNNN
jgi:hypothetical protein